MPEAKHMYPGGSHTQTCPHSSASSSHLLFCSKGHPVSQAGFGGLFRTFVHVNEERQTTALQPPMQFLLHVAVSMRWEGACPQLGFTNPSSGRFADSARHSAVTFPWEHLTCPLQATFCFGPCKLPLDAIKRCWTYMANHETAACLVGKEQAQPCRGFYSFCHTAGWEHLLILIAPKLPCEGGMFRFKQM